MNISKWDRTKIIVHVRSLPLFLIPLQVSQFSFENKKVGYKDVLVSAGTLYDPNSVLSKETFCMFFTS